MLAAVVDCWEGLALLARGDGTVLSASQAWGTIQIPAEDLKANGWRHYVREADRNITEIEASSSAEESRRAPKSFRNRYVSDDGRVTLLEWSNSRPFEDLEVFFATARILESSYPEAGSPTTEKPPYEKILEERDAMVWRNFLAEEQAPVSRWVADLEGEILYSEGGGLPPNVFKGTRMGRDYGTNPEFFRAVGILTAPGAPPSVVQFASGKEDNPDYAGLRYVNVYTLIRYPSGRPRGVAVTTTEITESVYDDPTTDPVQG